MRRVITFPLPCGGAGYCGGCAVRVLSGMLSEPTREESLTKAFKQGYRLACQARILGDVEVELPKIAPTATVSGVMPEIPLDPAIAKFRNGDMALTRALRRPSISFEGLGFRENGSLLGLAIDLGTTNISGALLDLESGETLVEGFIRNPQISKGADIITRLEFALEGELGELKSLAISGIEELAYKLSEASGVGVEEISSVAIVGNSVMHAFLLGLDVETLAKAPFRPPIKHWTSGPLSELGFQKLGDAWALIPPPLEGFVGSDALADLITLELLNVRRPSLLIDLGTNSEVLLLTEEKILATSAPAGSAFEMNVPSGVGGVRGGITRVRMRDGVFEIEVQGEPLGFTGSGLISAIAEMLRNGIISHNGGIVEGKDIEIARGPLGPIRLTQLDIREVQKSVAAVYSAWRILLEKSSLEATELDAIYMAGTFGSNVDPEDAIQIGLLPDIDPNRVVSIGNAALSGAKTLLLNKKSREIADKIRSEVIHVDLASEPSFKEEFVRGTFLQRR